MAGGGEEMSNRPAAGTRRVFLSDGWQLEHFGLEDPQVVLVPGEPPYSSRFGDSYHSRSRHQDETVSGEAGAESRFVFLEGSDLPGRWADRADFTIAELGFGAGRNFLATWHLWRSFRDQGSAAAPQQLHYVGIEGHPPAPELQRSMLRQFTEYGALAEELVLLRVPRYSSVQRVVLEHGSLLLTLAFGDAERILPQLELAADSWFLDGFAPKVNPSMWSPTLLHEVVRHSRPGCTYATYSAAAAVRRTLADLGVNVSQRSGFAGKKEMLAGVLPEGPGGQAKERRTFVKRGSRFDIAVLGGGIAGCAAAAVAAARGARVALIEGRASLAATASGNRAAIVMPQIAVKPDLRSRFYLAAYYLLLRELDRLASATGAPLLRSTGVLQLLTSTRLIRLAEELPALRLPPETIALLDQREAEERAGVSLSGPALLYAEGGFLDAPRLCETLVSASGGAVRLCLGTGETSLERGDGKWEVRNGTADSIAVADAVILATGAYCPALDSAFGLPIRWNRGQVAEVRESAASSKIRTVLCYDGYLTPAVGGRHLIGATYEHDARSDEFDPGCLDELLERLERAVPQLGLSSPAVSGRSALRATTRDRLPLAGPVPDPVIFRELCAEGGCRTIPPAAMVPGLYVTAGHGSRGVVSALLAAEILAHHLFGEPSPVETDLLDAVHPARFLARDIRRG